MNRKQFEDAKARIVNLCNAQDYFNGKDILFDGTPSHKRLPDDMPTLIENYANEILDAKIIEAAQLIVASADEFSEE